MIGLINVLSTIRSRINIKISNPKEVNKMVNNLFETAKGCCSTLGKMYNDIVWSNLEPIEKLWNKKKYERIETSIFTSLGDLLMLRKT
ncbi:MAG: hypothetical protein ACTSPY_12225 [Candidatus Helarchaeota archaeon]